MMLHSRLDERITRSREAIAKLNRKAEELQLEKFGFNQQRFTTSPAHAYTADNVPRVLLPNHSPQDSVLDQANSKDLQTRLEEIKQLSTQSHANFPLQQRVESNFTFVEDWNSNQTSMKDPALPQQPNAAAMRNNIQVNVAQGQQSAAQPERAPLPRSPNVPSPQSDASPGQQQRDIGFFRSGPGQPEPRFYKGMTKPVEVFRGNPDVQEMYKHTTERLKESYAQELAAALPSGAESMADRMVGLHVPIRVGLRVVAVDGKNPDAEGGPGMVTRVDEDGARAFVLWDKTGVECGWYVCDEKHGYPLKLMPAADATPFQEGSESRVTGGNSDQHLEARREAWEEEDFFSAQNAVQGLSDFLLF